VTVAVAPAGAVDLTVSTILGFFALRNCWRTRFGTVTRSVCAPRATVVV